MKNDILSQSSYRCKFDWGHIGARRAIDRGDIIVVVDVLSFSTTVALAIDQGAVIFPCGEDDDAVKLAGELEAELAVSRKDVPSKGRYSLSPLTFEKLPEGTRVLLPSFNGGTCVACADAAAYLFTGALVNATAVADAVNGIMQVSDLDATVVACGEREKQPPHELRMAIEDYLGAGAILSGLPFDKSPEARVCEAAYLNNTDRLERLIWDCVSGRELRADGFADDVTFACRLDAFKAAPALTASGFCPYGP